MTVTRLLALFVVTTVLVAAMATGAVAQTADTTDERTITVTATGSATAPADAAILMVAVTATAPDAMSAADTVADSVVEMQAALTDAGVGPNNVRTSHYNIYQLYGEDRAAGYQARHAFHITVEDVDRAGELIDVAVAAGATEVDGVQFTLHENTRAALRAAALTDAMTSAHEEAELLARLAGLSITGVHSVSTAGSVGPVVFTERLALDGTSFSPGPLSVTASVVVTYTAIEGDHPSVTVADRELSPGDTVMVTMEIRNAGKVVIGQPSSPDSPTLDTETAAIDAPPDRVLESFPPQWVWDETQDVITVDVMLSVPDDAEPGEYRFTVHAWTNADGPDGEVTEPFIVTVT